MKHTHMGTTESAKACCKAEKASGAFLKAQKSNSKTPMVKARYPKPERVRASMWDNHSF
jgi:sialic acid synthase SpsE